VRARYILRTEGGQALRPHRNVRKNRAKGLISPPLRIARMSASEWKRTRPASTQQQITNENLVCLFLNTLPPLSEAV
jgi:hypothetical protein